MLLPVHCFGDGMMMVMMMLVLCSSVLQNSLNCPEIKLLIASNIISYAVHILKKMTSHASIKLSPDRPSYLFDSWELAMIVYNTMVIFIMYRKHICTYTFPWSAWNVMVD